MGQRGTNRSAIAKDLPSHLRWIIRFLRLLCGKTTKGAMGKHETLFPLRFNSGDNFLDNGQLFFRTDADKRNALVYTVAR